MILHRNDGFLMHSVGSEFLSGCNAWFETFECGGCGQQELMAAKYYLKKRLEVNIVGEELDMSSPVDQNRAFHAKLEEWRQKAPLTPTCGTCARLDFNASMMKEMDAYQQGVKLVRSRAHKEEDKRSPNYGRETSAFLDYKCPKGHGISIELVGPDFEEYQKKQAKAKA